MGKLRPSIRWTATWMAMGWPWGQAWRWTYQTEGDDLVDHSSHGWWLEIPWEKCGKMLLFFMSMVKTASSCRGIMCQAFLINVHGKDCIILWWDDVSSGEMGPVLPISWDFWRTSETGNLPNHLKPLEPTPREVRQLKMKQSMGFSNVGYPQIPFSTWWIWYAPLPYWYPQLPENAVQPVQPRNGQEADNQKIPEFLKPLKSKVGRLSRTYSCWIPRRWNMLKLWIEDDWSAVLHEADPTGRGGHASKQLSEDLWISAEALDQEIFRRHGSRFELSSRIAFWDLDVSRNWPKVLPLLPFWRPLHHKVQ